MEKWMNIGHCQFDLMFGGVPQQVIGKMVYCDENGATILLENTGEQHFYSVSVIQHICLAP
jgi:hypothetical protein